MRTDSPKSKKKWLWLLLLLIPLGILSIPFLLFAMMTGTRLLSTVAGPVNIWNTPWHVPPVSDLVGYYELSDMNWQGHKLPKPSGFRLSADHRVEVLDVPAFDTSGEAPNCSYNGTGDWSLYQSSGVTLTINIRESTHGATGKPACDPTSLGGFQLLGHSPPYRFWYYVTDPDEEMGLKYVRRDR